MRRVPAALLAVTLVAFAPRADAVELTLAADAAAEAAASGRSMAARGEGYTIGTYLLFGVADALQIADDDRTVEAVVVGTPYERLRFDAYVSAYQNRPLAPAAAAQAAARYRGRVDFVVSAHSRGESDREFMQTFAGGTLDTADGRHLAASAVLVSDPVRDSYYRPDGKVLKRWLGQVTYRFALDAAVATASTPVTFSFSDDRGGLHRYQVTFANYR